MRCIDAVTRGSAPGTELNELRPFEDRIEVTTLKHIHSAAEAPDGENHETTLGSGALPDPRDCRIGPRGHPVEAAAVKLPHMSTPELVTVERDGAAAVVTLNRPEKRNALSLELRAELTDALNALSGDDAVRCLVLTGADPAFCAGMDTTEFGGDRAHKERIVELSVSLFRALGNCPKPIVAAINGPAVAGGFAVALLCDMRLASTEARMGFLENRRGIPPSYAAARAALPAALAADLCLTGRLLEPEEAQRLGVVAEVLAPTTSCPAPRISRPR